MEIQIGESKPAVVTRGDFVVTRGDLNVGDCFYYTERGSLASGGHSMIRVVVKIPGDLIKDGDTSYSMELRSGYIGHARGVGLKDEVIRVNVRANVTE